MNEKIVESTKKGDFGELIAVVDTTTYLEDRSETDWAYFFDKGTLEVSDHDYDIFPRRLNDLSDTLDLEDVLCEDCSILYMNVEYSDYVVSHSI